MKDLCTSCQTLKASVMFDLVFHTTLCKECAMDMIVCAGLEGQFA